MYTLNIKIKITSTINISEILRHKFLALNNLQNMFICEQLVDNM